MKNKALLLRILTIGLCTVIVVILVGRSTLETVPEPSPATPAPIEGAPLQNKPVESHVPPKAAATPSQKIDPATPKRIVLDLSTEFAKDNQQILSQFLERPADFGEHFVVAKWNCGTDCRRAAIIDRNTGKVYVAPTDNPTVAQPDGFVAYTLTSSEYKVLDIGRIKVYRFEGDRFRLIDTEELR